MAAPYAAEDADITLQLHNTLWAQLNALPALRKVYEEIEQPLVPVLLDMEEIGVLVDRKMLTTQSGELAKKMAELESKAHELAGGAVQPLLAEAAAANPVRTARTAGHPEDAEGTAVDGRGRARRTGQRLRAAGGHYRLPQRQQAEEHLHGQAAAADQRTHRPHPHVLPPGGCGNRTTVVNRPEPAEHSDPHA